MADWRLGTIGFGYDDWTGPFYPPGLKAGDRLAFYARYFDAVEIDATFHAAPDAARVRHWAAAVPDHFRFCLKAPRAVTHDPPLDRAVGPMRAFLDTAREMGPKLGAVLLQFPPSFGVGRAGDLDAFLGAMPGDVRLAVELRNRSWARPQTLDLLRARGCGLVAAEYHTRPRRIHVTADFLYVRWIGEHGRFDDHHAERADVSESLRWWRAAIAEAAPAVKTVYGFFNNDFAGYAAGTCNRFKVVAGLPVAAPSQAERGTLFE